MGAQLSPEVLSAAKFVHERSGEDHEIVNEEGDAGPDRMVSGDEDVVREEQPRSSNQTGERETECTHQPQTSTCNEYFL